MQPRTTSSPLVAFLYELMRDHVPIGVVEKIVLTDEVQREGDPNFKFALTNGHLAAYAEEVAERLKV